GCRAGAGLTRPGAVPRVQPAVPIVGLTGGMGAGKSTALEALARLGAAVLSTDAVVHELLASAQVRDAVVDRFGEEVAPGGVVDRAAVAAKTFADDADGAWLEGLLWPLVGKRAGAWIREVRGRTPPPRAAVIEVPLLFESGLTDGYDVTIAIVSDEQVRSKRAAGRGHVLPDERDPPAGGGRAPGPGADRRRALCGVEVRPATVRRGCARAHADPPGDRVLHRAPIRGERVHRERPVHAQHQRGVWQLLPALPARSLRRQRDACARRLQRRRGKRRQLGGPRRRDRPDAYARRDPVRRNASVRAACAGRPAGL